jgi:hypothetical protein
VEWLRKNRPGVSGGLCLAQYRLAGAYADLFDSGFYLAAHPGVAAEIESGPYATNKSEIRWRYLTTKRLHSNKTKASSRHKAKPYDTTRVVVTKPTTCHNYTKSQFFSTNNQVDVPKRGGRCRYYYVEPAIS